MKHVSLASLLASLTAAAVLPVRLELAAEMLFAAGIVVVMVQDYSARRALRFETAAPVASQFTASHPFRRGTVAARVTFRAPALVAESNRLAA